MERGVPGLPDRLKSGGNVGITAQDEAQILAATRKPPPKPPARYSSSPDSDFDTKAVDIIGLYLGSSGARGGLLCGCEDGDSGAGPNPSGAAVLARTSRTSRLRIRPQRHALAVRSARSAYGSCAGHDGRAPYKGAVHHLLGSGDRQPAAGTGNHVICDNLSAHKTKAVKGLARSASAVSIHCTPTYSSWLNQVEIWFAKIQRDLIARGVFTSTTDLRRKS